MMSPYEAIGKKAIVEIISKFYDLAFQDPIIGHFFFHSSKQDLIDKQVQFSIGLLGGAKVLLSENLRHVHQPFKINKAHFGRRQVLFAEILQQSDLPENLQKEWLEREERLRPLIINHEGTCLSE